MPRRYSLTRLRWPKTSGRTRVFIEDADPERYRLAAQAFTRAGYEVGPFCGGPHFHDRIYDLTPPGCMLIENGTCPLLKAADVIVYRFGLESPENRAVLDEIADTLPGIPVVVEATEAERDDLRLLHANAEVLRAPAALDDLVAAAAAVLEASRAAAP